MKTKDAWVLNTVQGYEVDLLAQPYQSLPPKELSFNREETNTLSEEVEKMLTKSAISLVQGQSPGFHTQLFVVPKKDGGQRPIINLKKLNSLVAWTISGKDTETNAFREKLPTSYWPHGDQSHPSHMTHWCDERSSDPVSGDISKVLNFLAYLFNAGYQYRSLNSYRSAISSVHEKVDGHSVGEHPLVARVLKGAFHERPPKPRYSETWDVSTVTTYSGTSE